MKYWTIESLKSKARMWSSSQIREIFAPLVHPKPGERFLDVGCGFSPLGHAFAPYVSPKGSITGLDHDPEIVEAARAFAQSTPWNYLFDFVVGDANSLNFPDASFDVVCCQQLLVNCLRPESVIREMIRVCRPKRGRLLFAENCNLGSFVFHPELDQAGNIKLSQTYQKLVIIGKSRFEGGDTSIGCRLPTLLSEMGI